MTGFWRTWMTVWCWAVVGFGVLLAGGAFEATSGPVRLLYALFNPAAPLGDDPASRFSVALMGAVSIGWGLTLLAATDAAMRLGDARLWRGITLSVAVWYVVDGVLSAATGFPLNIASNTLLLAGYLLPLWRSGVLGGRAGELQTA